MKSVKIPKIISLQHPKWLFKALELARTTQKFELIYAAKKPTVTPSGAAMVELLRWEVDASHNQVKGLSPPIPFPIHQKEFSLDYFSKSLKPLFFERFSELHPDLGDRLYDLELLFNELTQNALDHSGSDRFFVLLQPDAVGVFDLGVGIPAKLQQSYEFESDMVAIENALKKGVTTRRDRPGGFGLYYTLDHLKDRGGYLYLASGSAQLRRYLKSKKIERKKLSPSMRGTIIYCSLVQTKKAGDKK